MKELFFKYQNLFLWLILSLGMIGILVFEAREVGLTFSQWFWLIFIVVLVAGACIWIVSWGDDEPFEDF